MPTISPDHTHPVAAISRSGFAFPTWARIGGFVSVCMVVFVFVAVITRAAS